MGSIATERIELLIQKGGPFVVRSLAYAAAVAVIIVATGYAIALANYMR